MNLGNKVGNKLFSKIAEFGPAVKMFTIWDYFRFLAMANLVI